MLLIKQLNEDGKAKQANLMFKLVCFNIDLVRFIQGVENPYIKFL